jgi:hypothetical protein
MECRERDTGPMMMTTRPIARPATSLLLWSLHSLCSYSNFSL